jgi:subtilisin-like proprotein convertase family protein
MQHRPRWATWPIVMALALTGALGVQVLTPSTTYGVPTTHVFNSGALVEPIPDETTITRQTTNFAPAGLVTRVRVFIRLNHSYDGDLILRLRGPDGTVVLLAENLGDDGDDYGSGPTNCSGAFTVFDDTAPASITSGVPPFAGAFRPEQALTGFNGRPAAGIWTLSIEDDAEDDEGVLFCWLLEVTRDDPAPSPGPVACSPRPRVIVATTHSDNNQITVKLTASGANNTIRSLRFLAVLNGRVDLPGGPQNSPGEITFPIPNPGPTYSFALRRLAVGGVNARFFVTDGCPTEWSTFAGFGVRIVTP